MAKRYLSDQQKARIKLNQDNLLLEEMPAGEPGLLVAHYGSYVDIETLDKKVKRCQLRQSLPTLVVGDQVLWQQATPETAVIVAQLPRHSILYRPASRGK